MLNFPIISVYLFSLLITPPQAPIKVLLFFLFCFYLTVILFVFWSYSWNIIVEQSQCHCTTEQYIKILSTINHVLLDGCRTHSDIKRVIVWLLFSAKWATCQLYHGENKLHSMKRWWCPLCTKPTGLVWFH